MEQKKYLNFFNKLGYGTGDWAANMVYGLITTFAMVYLTTTAGMNAGIIGTLIMISKFADGITDVFCGTLIDRTKSKFGKARPWMLFSYIGNALCLIAVFIIPQSWGDAAKYAYFFIAYTLLNAVFYTANNISYSALTSLITRNNNERVQLGTFRFIFSTLANMFVNSMTMVIVYKFSTGDAGVATASGWRAVAIIYAIIGIVVNTFSVFSVKELPPEEGEEEKKEEVPAEEKITLWESLKVLCKNKYFLLITGLYFFAYFSVSVSMGCAAYFFMYIVGDMSKFGGFMNVFSLTCVAGLICAPFIVAKLKNMRKLNCWSFVIQIVFRILFVIGAYKLTNTTGDKNLLFITIMWGACSLFNCTFAGTINALIAETAEYSYLKTGKHLEGAMYSCSSVGFKVGSGVGSGLSGWLLAAAGFNGAVMVQTPACNNMITFMFAVIPLIVTVVNLVLFYFLKVEDATKKLREGNAA